MNPADLKAEYIRELDHCRVQNAQQATKHTLVLEHADKVLVARVNRLYNIISSIVNTIRAIRKQIDTIITARYDKVLGS